MPSLTPGLPLWLLVKSLPAVQETWTQFLGSIPGRSPGEGNGNPLKFSCLENPMETGAGQAAVHGVSRDRHDWVTTPSAPPPLTPKPVTSVLPISRPAGPLSHHRHAHQQHRTCEDAILPGPLSSLVSRMVVSLGYLLPHWLLFSNRLFWLTPVSYWNALRQFSGDFPGAPVVKTLCFHCSGGRVQSLVRELGSLMLCGTSGRKQT